MTSEFARVGASCAFEIEREQGDGLAMIRRTESGVAVTWCGAGGYGYKHLLSA